MDKIQLLAERRMADAELERLRNIEKVAKYVVYNQGHYEFCYQADCTCGIDELIKALESHATD